MYVYNPPIHLHGHCHHYVGFGFDQRVCPTCGTCPTCGSRPWVAPIQPVQPIWIQPVLPYRVHVNQSINRLAGAA